MKVTLAEHFKTCPQPRDMPNEGWPEVAFLGRSNVGKSSLLNRLVGRKKLARTSRTPGKTRAIELYRLQLGARTLLFVDLPGYGYAKVARSERVRWQALVEGYLQDRDPLRAAILLQDLRRDVSKDETLLLQWLAEHDVPSLVALTKVDKLKPMRRARRVRELKAAFESSHCPLVATSATSGEGMDTLWRAIRERL